MQSVYPIDSRSRETCEIPFHSEGFSVFEGFPLMEALLPDIFHQHTRSVVNKVNGLECF